jgi:glutaredoxin 3
MPPVDIYTTRFCGFCHRAKVLLQRNGIDFTEINLSGDRQRREEQRREEMIERANGRFTVQQIFVGNVHVGGCDDLYALERGGKLDALLAGEGQPA